MCVINVSNKRKTGKWRKICLFPAGFEPATLCVWGTRDNRYTMETCYVCRLLFGFHITGWLPKKWKKLSSHLGVEPRTFGLEVQRAIHCANGTPGILGSAFSKFIEYTRYWRLDTIYSSRCWKVRYLGIRQLPDMISYSLVRSPGNGNKHTSSRTRFLNDHVDIPVQHIKLWLCVPWSFPSWRT